MRKTRPDCCPKHVELDVTKAASADAVKAGDPLTFTLTFTNKGPDDARGSKVYDDFANPEILGLSDSTPVAVAYTPGTEGAASTTIGGMRDGLEITRWPADGVVTVTYSGVVQEGFAGQIVQNHAHARAPQNVVNNAYYSSSTSNTTNNTWVLVPVEERLVDLAIGKTMVPPTATLDPLVPTVITTSITATNSGPDAADGAVVRDVIPPNLTSISAVTVTYGGGAAGPTTTTAAELATGFAVPVFPVGGVVVFSFTATAAGTGTIINVATITPPAGVRDSNTANNTAISSVVVNDCYVKCSDNLVLYRDFGVVTGAGVCIGLNGVSYVNGRAVWQARDDTFILGAGVSSAGGATSAYLQETFTNPYPFAALLRVDVQTHANALAADGPAPGGTPLLGRHATVIHNIGEVLTVSPPNFGGNNTPVPSNWAWTPLETSNPSVHWNDSTVAYGYKPLTQASNSMFYERVLQPGESVTLYSQFWATVYSEGVFQYVFHGGMRGTAKLYRNAGGF